MVFATAVQAAGKPTVYSDSVVTTLSEDFALPVKLKNNTGLMGFRISVKFPEAQFKLKNITSGSLTKDGLFNTTVSDYNSVKNEFDVVWSNTENSKGDGTLFMLSFETNGYADYGDYKIEFSVSNEDTFNEKYDPVELKCDAVPIKIVDEKSFAKKQLESATTPQSQNSGTPVSDDYLVSSVEAVIESFGESDISNILDKSQQESVVKFVNSRNTAYAQGSKQYSSFDELKSDYNKALTNEATSNVLESIDGEKIISISDEIPKKYGVKSFSELSEKDKQAAIDEALGAISSAGGETENFRNVSDSDAAA